MEVVSMIQLFNSDVEIGIRVMIILEVCNPIAMALDKIMYLDYILLYGIKNENGETLHPSYHLQILELEGQRNKLKNSILYLIKKDLISVTFNDEGIFYHSNVNSLWFVQNMNNDYAKRMVEFAKIMAEDYKTLSVMQLKKIVREEKII